MNTKQRVIPYLKYINGYQLVVMGVQLPITQAQARVVYAQLRSMEVGHG